MRIIAGIHRSRILKTLPGMNTRPMTDRMKESIFNTIGPYFDGSIVLDLFGGAGALSLESISRGAGYSYINDLSKDAIKIIKQNVSSLNEDNHVMIMNSDYKQALKYLSNKKFDLIFLDPPYRLNITNEIIDYLFENQMLGDHALIVCQYVKGNHKIDERLNVIKNYAYGTSEVIIYEKD